ncbi:transposase [Paenibacillus silviterrae]|uniref:transposase n=1 Tax=Paenibacillus silviterrae TaxID=3242194 RepID=UPI0025436943|nr:transposase [Paenibacillus chinjuensis]
MDQLFLPPSLGELIPANHVVRIVDKAIERLDDKLFIEHYPGGGRSNYHPKLMTKVIVYGYTQRLYSSHLIAKAVRENIPFMWLAAMQQPDFRTINRFRSERMKELINKVFTEVLEMLIEEGFVKLDHYFLDGTKIEANANRYTFDWKKSKGKHQAKLQDKIQDLLQEIDQVEHADAAEYGTSEMNEETEVTSEKLERMVNRLEES